MPVDLSALVGSRICHDLISPIGAIGNGVELLTLTQGGVGAEMDLISESVNNANGRIRFFRIAYGASAQGQSVSRTEIVSILTTIAASGRYSYSWEAADDCPRDMVRMAFLLLQCLETALPLGGHITIRRTGDAWELDGNGQRVRLDDAAWAQLQSPDPDFAPTAAQVQFALLPALLAEAGRTLSVTVAEERITLRF